MSETNFYDNIFVTQEITRKFTDISFAHVLFNDKFYLNLKPAYGDVGTCKDAVYFLLGHSLPRLSTVHSTHERLPL